MYDKTLGYAEVTETLEYLEPETWARFAAAFVAKGQSNDAAAQSADRMMAELRRRFGTGPAAR